MSIEDMKVGVIYRNKQGKAHVLSPCMTCGKQRAVILVHGKPKSKRCHPCAMGTPEKRAIMSKAHKGIPQSQEQIRNRVEKVRVYQNDPEWCRKMSESCKGHIVSEEARKRSIASNKGQPNNPEQIRKITKTLTERFKDKKWADIQLEKLRIGRSNIKPEREKLRREKIGKAFKELWKTQDYREKVIKNAFAGMAIRPTKPEIKLNELLQCYFPRQWIYNGDFSKNVIIGGLVPDFVNINGKKQVIELFGDYFHTPNKYINVGYLRTEKGRLGKFKEFGYDCLIIWEREMKHPEKVLAKIEEFNGR